METIPDLKSNKSLLLRPASVIFIYEEKDEFYQTRPKDKPAKKGAHNIFSLQTGVLEHTSIFQEQSLIILVTLKQIGSGSNVKQFFIALPTSPRQANSSHNQSSFSS